MTQPLFCFVSSRRIRHIPNHLWEGKNQKNFDFRNSKSFKRLDLCEVHKKTAFNKRNILCLDWEKFWKGTCQMNFNMV